MTARQLATNYISFTPPSGSIYLACCCARWVKVFVFATMLTRIVVRRAQPCLLGAVGARGVATEKEMRKKIATTTDIEKITSRHVFSY